MVAFETDEGVEGGGEVAGVEGLTEFGGGHDEFEIVAAGGFDEDGDDLAGEGFVLKDLREEAAVGGEGSIGEEGVAGAGENDVDGGEAEEVFFDGAVVLGDAMGGGEELEDVGIDADEGDAVDGQEENESGCQEDEAAAGGDEAGQGEGAGGGPRGLGLDAVGDDVGAEGEEGGKESEAEGEAEQDAGGGEEAEIADGGDGGSGEGEKTGGGGEGAEEAGREDLAEGGGPGLAGRSAGGEVVVGRERVHGLGDDADGEDGGQDDDDEVEGAAEETEQAEGPGAGDGNDEENGGEGAPLASGEIKHGAEHEGDNGAHGEEGIARAGIEVVGDDGGAGQGEGAEGGGVEEALEALDEGAFLSDGHAVLGNDDEGGVAAVFAFEEGGHGGRGAFGFSFGERGSDDEGDAGNGGDLLLELTPEGGALVEVFAFDGGDEEGAVAKLGAELGKGAHAGGVGGEPGFWCVVEADLPQGEGEGGGEQEGEQEGWDGAWHGGGSLE